VLKHELQKDEAWQEFSQLAAQTRRKVQQTSLAALAPPNQRTKARYMNVDILIQWGGNMLTFFERQQKEASSEFDPEQLEKKLGWITRFREQLEEWEELIHIITVTESFVRKQGLYRDSYLELQELLTILGHTERTKKARVQLLAFAVCFSNGFHNDGRCRSKSSGNSSDENSSCMVHGKHWAICSSKEKRSLCISR